MNLDAQVEDELGAGPSLADFDYDLPPDRIAQMPAADREAARLLVLDRNDAGLRHSVVAELSTFLRAGDLLVFNDTKVRPARLFGRGPSGGAVELLVVAQRSGSRWECLGKPAKRLRPGSRVRFGTVTAEVCAAAAGTVLVDFGPDTDVPALLRACGEIPLPPYIRRPDGPLPIDADRYQTVFAAHEGAVAAPTAGLHFGERLLAALDRAGVERAFVTLHVGPGTFLPVREEALRNHVMAAEWAEIPPATADAIDRAKREGRRVIAVGTTTTRALESRARLGTLEPGGFCADAFITPGFRFRVVDALFTNFHLPHSTLLMLVSAFAGRERVMAAYAEAVRLGYRFYSYGDAMLIG